MTSYIDRTIPLAAALEILLQVREIANHGRHDQQICSALVGSLFSLDQGDVAALYGGISSLERGIRQLEQMLGGSGSADRDPLITRYLVGALHLEGKLSRSAVSLNRVRDTFATLAGEIGDNSPLDLALLARIDTLYQEVISPLGPRIMVSGEQVYLNRDENRYLIRTLLLAAIRALMLWRHYGGGKWQLLFRRRNYLASCRQLLKSGG
jgi:high frequency lysogenization protein